MTSQNFSSFYSIFENLFLVLVIILILPVTILLVNQQTQTEQNATTGAAVPTLGGCQLFPSNSVFNYDVSSLPVDSHSSTYINTVGSTWKLSNYFGHSGAGPDGGGFPYNIVDGTQAVPLQITQYYSESDPAPYPTIAPFPNYPIPSNPLIENGSDRHLLILNSGNCHLYEVDAMYPSQNTDGSWSAYGAAAIFDLNSNNLRPDGWSSADAAGLPMIPLLIKYDEVAAGVINHPMRFLLPCTTQHTYIWPARHTDGCSSSTSLPPEGARFRLKASVDVSGFPPQSKPILVALQHYGMFLADNDGGVMSGLVGVAGSPDSRWDYNDLASLGNIPFSDFEMVDESGLISDKGSAQVKGVINSSPTSIAKPDYTLTPTSKPTGSSSGINLSLTACPHGLGNCGDNANPNSIGNLNPLHHQKPVTLAFFNGNNQQTAQAQGTVSYNTLNKNFQGSLSITNIPNGSYLAQIKLSGFLPKQIPGIININSSNQTITLSQVTLVNGDINNDNQLDIVDYNLLISCFGSKANTSSCHDKVASDINDDGVIDGTDYNLFLRELSVQRNG